jgi:hypothetical protein
MKQNCNIDKLSLAIISKKILIQSFSTGSLTMQKRDHFYCHLVKPERSFLMRHYQIAVIFIVTLYEP